MSGSGHPHHGYRVIFFVFLGSVLLGIWAYRQYVISKNALHQDQQHFQEIGQRLSGEQCVDEILKWATQCQARQVTAQTKKACALAYRAIDKYCQHVAQGPN